MSDALFLEDIEIIVFRVGNITIGLPITEVREIFKSPTITPVHTAFSYVSGVINLRGSIVTIIDLSNRMKLPINKNNKAVHIVLVEFGEELIGLLVDGIEDSVFASSDNFFPVPATVNGADSNFFRALFRREEDLVAMLDLDNTLDTEAA
jgi:purine-binding chemotaxis protein CheW